MSKILLILGILFQGFFLYGAATVTVYNRLTNAVAFNLELRTVPSGGFDYSLRVPQGTGIVAVGSSASIILHSNTTDTFYYSKYIRVIPLSYFGSWTNVPVTNTVMTSNGGSHHIYVLGGTNNAPCWYQFPLKNNDTAIRTFYASKNGFIDGTKKLLLPPGYSGVLGFEAPCNENWTVVYFPYGDYDPALIGGLDPNQTPVGNTPPTPTNYPPVTPNSPVTYNPTNESPIFWTGSTNDNQTGFSALYDAITKFASQNDRNLQRIISNSTTVNVTVTNNNAGGGSTNNFDDSNIVSRLDAIHHAITNHSPFEAGEQALPWFSNIVGNASETASLLHGDFNTALSEYGVATDFDLPEPNPDFWRVELVEGAPIFNFQPSHYLGDVFATAKSFLTWVLVVFYVGLCLKDVISVIKSSSTARQLSYPDIAGTAAGFGGNLGVVAAPLYLGVWLTAYAALLTALVAAMVVFVGGEIPSLLALNPFGSASGSVAAALGEAALFFPFQLFFTFGGAYLVWKVSLAGITALYFAINRLLVGS